MALNYSNAENLDISVGYQLAKEWLSVRAVPRARIRGKDKFEVTNGFRRLAPRKEAVVYFAQTSYHKFMFKKISLISSIVFIASCAQLHHVQIGEIDNNPRFVQKPFEIKLSEVGVDIQEAGRITKAIAGRGSNNEAEKIANLIALFQMGPRTGNPVYVKDYAKNLIQLVYEKCSSGRVTGLTSVRETRKYPVISGEIVKLTGYCLLPKGG